MKKNKKIWSYGLALALAVSNLSVVAAPFSSIVAQAAAIGQVSVAAPANTVAGTAVSQECAITNAQTNANAVYTFTATDSAALTAAGITVTVDNTNKKLVIATSASTPAGTYTLGTVNGTDGTDTGTASAAVTLTVTREVGGVPENASGGVIADTSLSATPTNVTKPISKPNIAYDATTNVPNYIAAIKTDGLSAASLKAALKTESNYRKFSSTATTFNNGIAFTASAGKIDIDFPSNVEKGEYTFVVAKFASADGPTVTELADLAGDNGAVSQNNAEYFVMNVNETISIDDMRALITLDDKANKTTIVADDPFLSTPTPRTYNYNIKYSKLGAYQVADGSYTYEIAFDKTYASDFVSLGAFTPEAYTANSLGSTNGVITAKKPGSFKLVVNAIKGTKKTQIADLDVSVVDSVSNITFEEADGLSSVAVDNSTYSFTKKLTVTPTITNEDTINKEVAYSVYKANDTLFTDLNGTGATNIKLGAASDTATYNKFNKVVELSAVTIEPGASVTAGEYVFAAKVDGQTFTWPFTVVAVPATLTVKGADGVAAAGSADIDVPGKLSLYQTTSGVTKAVDASKVKWTLAVPSDSTYVDLEESTGVYTVKKHKASPSTITVNATYELATGIKNTTPATYVITTKAGAFELSKVATTIVAGESENIKATYGGKEITGVVWSVDDSQVASVVDGTITGLKRGSATVTAKYTDKDGNNHSKTIAVTVDAQTYKLVDANGKAVTGPLGLNPGNTLQLGVQTTSGFDYDGTVVWKTGNDKIATVDSNGLVTILSDAKTTTKVTSAPAANVSAVITAYEATGTTALKDSTGKNVAVTIVAIDSCYKATDANGKLTNETIDTSKATEYTASLYKDEALEIKVTKDGNEVSGKWTVKPGSYVKVENGKIIATKVGAGEKAEFTPDGETSVKISVAITVVSDSISLKSDNITLTSAGTAAYTGAILVDNTYNVSAFYGVENITSKVEWKSSDETIATVKNGVIDAKAAGTGLTITADYVVDGASLATATITLNVKTADAATEELKTATTEAQDAAKALDAAAKELAAKENPTKDDVAKVEALAKTAADKAAAVQAVLDADLTKDKATINAAKSAVEAATYAKAESDKAIQSANDKIKAAEEAAKKAEEEKKAAEEAAKKADGSEPNKPAPVNNELKDPTTGATTGYVVTNATAGQATVEYKGNDADKKAKSVKIPDTVKDASGNEYKVTSIAANAFAGADTKTVTIGKNIKKIDPNAFKGSKVKKVNVKGTKLTSKMAKAIVKNLKKGATVKVTGANAKKNKKLLKKQSAVKKGKVKVK